MCLQKRLLELNLQFSYPNLMFKRLTHFFAWILLVSVPMQALATANMLVCNSMMQSNINQRNNANMPCHNMANMTEISQQSTAKHQSPCCKPSCKTICATLCASVSAVGTLPSDIKPAPFLAATRLISLLHQSYDSITLPSLQRPPILLT